MLFLGVSGRVFLGEVSLATVASVKQVALLHVGGYHQIH